MVEVATKKMLQGSNDCNYNKDINMHIEYNYYWCIILYKQNGCSFKDNSSEELFCAVLCYLHIKGAAIYVISYPSLSASVSVLGICTIKYRHFNISVEH